MPFKTYMDETDENIKFDKQEFLWEQYDEYISKNTVTAYERRLLRKWVFDDHSVYENPGSRYLPDCYPPKDFLDTYREDKEITQLLRGKTEEEKEEILRSYMGYKELGEPPAPTAKEINKHLKKLEHELFYLWEYISSESLWSEAKEYLEDHDGEPIPFGYLG